MLRRLDLRAEVTATGIVQGVGFRPFVYRLASECSLVGYVRNRGDAGVEIVVEGEENDIRDFVVRLRRDKPTPAEIHDLQIQYGKDQGDFKEFIIAESSQARVLMGSTIPADLSICNACTEELRNPKDRRYEYFFITCTDCGPRYTTIEALPYDRPNTTIAQFPMCASCSDEFRDPRSRRFHAQTIACAECGPRVFLADRNGKDLLDNDPIRTAGRLLEEGHIVAIKGYGGFHVATASTISDTIEKLRGVKHRSQKPFAIMARDLAAIRSFANIEGDEQRLLVSPAKPIVLVEKSDHYYLSSLISPNLDRVGVMLPYTALHLMLFDHVKEPAFVMTSANPPNEPIITQNREAVTRLGFIVDYFLFHDREIAQRCDDSVARVMNGRTSLIRRSRGFAPTPIRLGSRRGSIVLGLGAELNVTSCVIIHDKAFISQHIGDVETPETYQFLKDATKHLLALTNAKLDAIGCDLHPLFNTSRFAHEFGEEKGLPVFPVQHHYAHVSGLMFEHNLDEIMGIACDGYGYGADGNAWGGEIVHGGATGFKRLGHLQEQPMVGGDLATKYPLRMAAGILRGFDGWEEWLQSKAEHFTHHEREVELVIRQLNRHERLPSTTSCGRVLDAVAAILDICFERSYEGEPAMKLEAVAKGGRDVLHLEPIFDGKSIETRQMFQRIFELREKESSRDLAFSAQAYLASALAHFAVDEAKSLGTKDVGFTGGVAYNKQMVSTIEKIVLDQGMQFVIPVQIPCGDGGSSFGQACAASLTFSKK